MIKHYITLMLKGAGMGAANVVPGVSGGTIALITGIFHKLIDSIKALDIKAVRFLLKGKFKSLALHINLDFLIAVFTGIAISILTVAKFFGYMFEHYPIYIWSFFFGLILASVYFVGKNVDKWRFSVILSLCMGTAIAIMLSVLKPAAENSNQLYLFICGIVGTCSMILPGLSGSFVLILMGNYHLIMIDAVNNLRIDILLPVVLGGLFGLLAFSHFLSWIFKKFRDQTIALLTGFILGSIGSLWPWKEAIYATTATGEPLVRKGKMVVESYQWMLPKSIDLELTVSIVLMIVGMAIIIGTEYMASRKNTKSE